MKQLLFIILTLSSLGISAQEFEYIPVEQYNCNFTNEAIEIDGKIDEQAWESAQWTKAFVDIEGDKKPRPKQLTRAKMLWNDEYLYVAFKLYETHIWANLKQRDTVIFHNNDIEIFLDIDGDTHNYVEYELNALNTLWDLYLSKPYREGGVVLNDWDHKGLKTGVFANGSINDSNDEDEYWSVEFAIPWKGLLEMNTPKIMPKTGEEIRINFSRVQWDHQITANSYQKKTDSNGKALREHNWVWSPMGLIDMHRPELWGVLYLTKDGNIYTYNEEEEKLRQILAHLYKKQKAHFYSNGSYLKQLKKLESNQKLIKLYNLKMTISRDQYTIVGKIKNGKSMSINHEGKISKL
jgi:hypothetical protein